MTNNYIKDFKTNNYDSNLKFDICIVKKDKKIKAWGVSSFKTKTLYNYEDEIRPATKEEEEKNESRYNESGKLLPNFSFPSRYFVYVIKNGKPLILVENRDQKIENGKIIQSDKYFKPATIAWHETNDKFTHYIRETDIPFLSITSKSKMNIKPSSVKPNTVFHVNNKGWIIQEQVVIKNNRLWTKNGLEIPIIWSQKGRLMNDLKINK